MRRLTGALYGIAIALWVGGLWAIGYLAAPTLFAELPDRMLAGRLAGEMFRWQAWLGFTCGAYLLAFLILRQRWRVLHSGPFWLVMVMLLLVAAGHFGLQPLMAELKAQVWPQPVMESVVRDRFAAWHGVASILYLVQSLLGLLLVAMQDRGRA